MTNAFAGALASVRHLLDKRLLVQDDGSELTAKVLRRGMKSAQRFAGLRLTGKFHALRHTFCSHLAMRGASAQAIQESRRAHAPHEDDAYMHLAKGQKEQAIRLLDRRPASTAPGGRVEVQAGMETL